MAYDPALYERPELAWTQSAFVQTKLLIWDRYLYDVETRAAVLRGGSSFQPQGSFWYFPQAYRLDRHAKYLLMSPARDRSGRIGFRCVVDAR